MSNTRKGRVLGVMGRANLLGSVAGVCLAVAAGTGAQAAVINSGDVVREAQGLVSGADFVREPQIVISEPGTPATAVDPVEITGVGQMIVDQQNGFIGLCTVSLVNPRTVVFAAHCVNDEPATNYGAASGGKPIGFGFSNVNRPAVREWFLPGPGQYQTNKANYFYNANSVVYHPASLEPDAASFLYGDVAMASLDTAATGIPTWSMLFSALPATPGGAEGTGYHVVLSGYGNNGSAETGSTGGIDYRRRLAENMLGGLASIDDFEAFLFGGASGVLPQNVYWIDFDDPRRGTAEASPFDFNAWRDNATPNEGITASGDSGGPLILDDTFDKPVIIGTLSGGYTRFFNGQPPNGYGTASFYQPLYLYWDWIAANNPYRYVSALAGDGAWTDPTHWVSELDPNYQIIGPDGQLVNGVPTEPGEGPAGTDGKFGEACFESSGFSDCVNVATGEVTSGPRPIGTAGSGSATVSAGSLGGTATPQAPGGGVSAAALPAATVENGLPGASGFVPNNTDGDRLTTTPPRYYDVTLAATGTTTLDTAVTIDRLTLAGVGAGLVITSTGSLTSNIDINQLTGSLQVDGSLTTPGDFFMMTGGLSGRGTITTPFFTNMAGVIAPGTPGTVGTLNFQGNLVLASGSALLIDLGPNGSSDRVAVAATQFNEGAPLDGQANVGGLVAFGAAAGVTPQFGDTYTFLTAEGGVTGAFGTPGAISAILIPRLIYTETSVQMTLDAAAYADVVANTPVQQAYAQLLDQNRIQYDQYEDIYSVLDLGDADFIGATLEGLAPRAETLKGALGKAALDGLSRFYRDRLTSPRAAGGGSFAVIGKPVQLASLALGSFENGGETVTTDASETTVFEGALPDQLSGYLAGGYITGDSAPMPSAVGGGRDDFDGFFVAAGMEMSIGDRAVVGGGLAYADLSGETSGMPQTAEGNLYQAALYGSYDLGKGWSLNGQLTAGRLDSNTRRLAVVGPAVFDLRTSDKATTYTGEVGVAYQAVDAAKFTLSPIASLRVAHIGYDPTEERGGGPALRFQRDDVTTYEGRFGVAIAGKSDTIKPWVTLNYVLAGGDDATGVRANFVGGVGPDVTFALASEDDNWGEIGFGLSAGDDMVKVSVAADTTVGRDDVESQTYRASVKIQF
ncbi:MAG: autotransporter domain-containing protein [Pseudomonadota bacterium]